MMKDNAPDKHSTTQLNTTKENRKAATFQALERKSAARVTNNPAKVSLQ